jgi:hypothetical protein
MDNKENLPILLMVYNHSRIPHFQFKTQIKGFVGFSYTIYFVEFSCFIYVICIYLSIP